MDSGLKGIEFFPKFDVLNGQTLDTVAVLDGVVAVPGDDFGQFLGGHVGHDFTPLSLSLYQNVL